MAGTSVSIGPAARLTGARAVLFEEDDAAVVRMIARFGYPTAHAVVTPRCLAFERHGTKHLTYPGYHELAYLHPARFTPDPGVREALGVAPGERVFLLRRVSLTSHHDAGETGLSEAHLAALVERLLPHGRVFLSTEAPPPAALQPYVLPTPPSRIFDVMALADVVIGDSQTMAAEAAVLGTPSLRCNTFVGRLAYLEELEHRYGLTVGFRPHDFERLLAHLDGWLAQPDLRDEWQARRRRMLEETVDVTAWILDLFRRLARRGGGGRRP
jgi:predicted glycosyltransferase